MSAAGVVAERPFRLTGSVDPVGGWRGEHGFSAIGLLISLIILGLMAVVAVKALDRGGPGADADKTLNDIRSSVASASGQPTAPPTTEGGLPGISGAHIAACLADRATLDTAEQQAVATTGGPLSAADLFARGFLRQIPTDYRVVLTPGGGYQLQPVPPCS